MSYSRGMDVLGVAATDFVPWLNVVSSVVSNVADTKSKGGGKDDKAGGGLGGLSGLLDSKGGGGAGGISSLLDSKGGGKSTEETVKKMLADERARQKLKEVEASARRTRTILYVVLGVVGAAGVGITAWKIAKR